MTPSIPNQVSLLATPDSDERTVDARDKTVGKAPGLDREEGHRDAATFPHGIADGRLQLRPAVQWNSPILNLRLVRGSPARFAERLPEVPRLQFRRPAVRIGMPMSATSVRPARPNRSKVGLTAADAIWSGYTGWSLTRPLIGYGGLKRQGAQPVSDLEPFRQWVPCSSHRCRGARTVRAQGPADVPGGTAKAIRT